MGNVILIAERIDALDQLRSTISQHFPNAQIQVVNPASVIGLLLLDYVSLIIYVVPVGKEVDFKVISEIKSVTDKAPLLIYAYFEQMNINFLALLDKGVHGLLSADSGPSRQIMAFDALLRGGSYIDEAVRFQALANLLRP